MHSIVDFFANRRESEVIDSIDGENNGKNNKYY